MKQRLKQMLWSVSPALFNLVTKPRGGQTFSIGIFTGPNLLALTTPKRIRNPVLSHTDVTDVPATFVADPFMVKEDGRWCLFFEVMNKATDCGQVGLATSTDGFAWRYSQIVLREPFHLAFPYVFRSANRYFMVPDSPEFGVRLYTSIDFPHHWEFVSTLIEGGRFSDSTVFKFNGCWWLMTAWSPTQGDTKVLRLYFADDPIGPWHEHPSSPLTGVDADLTRPAGRVVLKHGRPVRFAQDGVPTYGTQVRAFEIVTLSRCSYRERELQSGRPVLQGSGKGWNADGMHHIDAHELDDGSWIAYVDGWYE